MIKEDVKEIIREYFQETLRDVVYEHVKDIIMHGHTISEDVKKAQGAHDALKKDATYLFKISKEINEAIRKFNSSLVDKEKKADKIFKEIQNIYKFVKIFELDTKKINKLSDIVEAAGKLQNRIKKELYEFQRLDL